MTRLTPAIFLDRDGVINKLILGGKAGDKESYIHSKEQVEWCDGVDEAFKIFYFETDYDMFIVSNQSGIGRWAGEDKRFNYPHISELFIWTLRRIEAMTSDDERFAQDVIKEFMFCPHLPDAGCSCRKPKPGMIYALAVKWGIDLSRSWMIGDSVSDMQAGWNAGIRKLIRVKESPVSEDFTGETIARHIKWNNSHGMYIPSLYVAAKFIRTYDGIWEGRR
jgi:D-glycero-D-manno-heptose 1,7-bisphosphate phosphatase